MNGTCPKCGLPRDLCVCETIAIEQQKIKVYVEEKKFKKVYTIIEGVDSKQVDMKELTKKLKNKLACGGTIKDGKIELQGDHKQKVMKVLVEAGFAPETIEIK